MLHRVEKLKPQTPSWSNKKFHASLYTATGLLAFMIVGAVHVANIISVKLNNAVTASYSFTYDKPKSSPIILVKDIRETYSPPPMVTQVDAKCGDWSYFKKVAEELSPIYDYPLGVLLSQASLESSRGKSHFAKSRCNYFGLGAYDANPNNAFTFANPHQAIIYYMLLIKNHYPEAYEARFNPTDMIQAIKAGGYATDPDYVAKVMSMEEWQ